MRKGQAALEFLMTYGWAILVVIVAIGALTYFGVFNTDLLVPESCEFNTGLYCSDYILYSDSLSLDIGNSIGRSINITNVTASLDSSNCSLQTGEENKSVPNGDSKIFNLRCDPIDEYGKRRVDLTVFYSFIEASSDYVFNSTGSMLVQVQQQ